jgi:uncharacterized membrane protein (DUF2068 family)
MSQTLNMSQTTSPTKTIPVVEVQHDALWLRVIGAGKVLKALTLIVIGISVLRLIHTGFGDQMAQLADLMRYSPESKLIHWIFDKASLLTDQRLEQVAAVAMVYGATELVESYGLLMRRTWGEYLTLILTAMFLPLDIYELFDHFTWVKLAFTVLNVLVVWYLAWLILRNRRTRAAAMQA